MRKTVLFLALAAPLSVALLIGQGSRPAAAPKVEPSGAAAQKAVVDKYCVGCHNDRLKTAKLSLENFDFEHIADHADRAELVIRKLRAGLMPPAKMPRPEPEALNTLVTWMESELDHTMTD